MKTLFGFVVFVLLSSCHVVTASSVDSSGFDRLSINGNFFGSVGFDQQDSMQTIYATNVSFQFRRSRAIAMLAGFQTGIFEPGREAVSWFCMYTSLTTFFQGSVGGLIVKPTLTFSGGTISLEESRTIQLSLSSEFEYPILVVPTSSIENILSLVLLAGYSYDFLQKSSGYFCDIGFRIGEMALFTFNVTSFFQPQDPVHNIARSR